MRRLRVPIFLIAVLTASCGSSGGGGEDPPPVALWGQFRQNSLRTGQGFGIVQDNDAIVDIEVVDELSAENPFPSAISSSPAIDADSTLYIGSEGGTLAAFVGDDDLNRLWSVTSCGACPAGNQRLGPLVSTPAVYTLENNLDDRKETDIIVGSMDSAVFMFRSLPDDDPVVDESDCSVCFWRGNGALERQLLEDDSTALVSAEFVSSPTFSINFGTGLIAGIFIGARITVEHSDGSTEVFGKLYAINNDGSLRWEFPRPGESKIGAVTSSPTVAQGNTLYFTAGPPPQNPGLGDFLYSVTEAGNLKRSVAISNLTDPGLPFSPSVVAGVTIFASSVNGVIHAMNPDGTFRWNTSFPGQRFVSSFAVGNQNEPTATPELAATPTPTGTLVATPVTTPTATETPLRIFSTLLGVAESGMLIVLDASDGGVISPTGEMPSVPVEGTVESSPALSADFFLIYGTTAGQLFTINTANGQLPRFCNGGFEDGSLCTDNRDCVDSSAPSIPPTPQPVCGNSSWPILLPRSCRDGDDGTYRAQQCASDEDCDDGDTCARPAIRSSPALDLDGTVYFGADDGRIYAVAASDEVAPSPLPTPTPPPPTSPPGDTATATPTIELSPTPTTAVEPTASPTEATTASPTSAPTESPTPEPGMEATATESPTAVVL